MTDPTVARNVVKRFQDEAWGTGDLGVVDELCSPRVVLTHNQVTIRGVRTLKDTLAELWAAFPDSSYGVDLLESWQGGVVARWHADGTHLGRYAGIESTEIPVSFWGISQFVIRDALVDEIWVVSTFPAALEALRAEAGRKRLGET